jgi:hypothetical protein
MRNVHKGQNTRERKYISDWGWERKYISDWGWEWEKE